MNLSKLFQNLKAQNISLFTFTILALFVLAIFVFLTITIIYLYKRVKYLTKVRYGFGGKPLFSLLIVFGIIAAIPLTFYSAQRSVDYVNLALAEKDAIIQVDIIDREDDFYLVSFLAVPIINDTAWGDDEYTITWDIQGNSTFRKVEMNRSKDRPSYFAYKIIKGTYNINIIIESQNFYMEKEEVVIIE